MAKKFNFKLANVLKYRNVILEKKKRELGIIRANISRQLQKINDLMSKRVNAKEELKNLRQGKIDITQIRLQEAYLSGIGFNIRSEEGILYNLRTSENQKRLEYVEARKKVRVLEKLKEKQLQNYNYEISREEMKFMDEIAQIQKSAL